ncbi:MAG: hypothetical protein ACYCSO_10275 [Cuniculiplasma sp.]
MKLDNKISFEEWERLFITGKTKAVYLSLLTFIIYAITILYSRTLLFYFIVAEVGAFASFGVLVDLVSHLFNDGWNSEMSQKEWKRRFLSGRTHDSYGIIIQIGCSLVDIWRYPIAIVSLFFLLPELYMVYTHRFHH